MTLDTALKSSSQSSNTQTWRSWLQRLTPYLLIAPTLGFVILFTIYPAISSLFSSLYEPGRRATDAWEFVGVQNYVDLFDSSHFLGSRFSQILGNTFIFSIATVVIGMALALMMALLLNRALRGLGIWRFCVVYPALLPTIGAASFWAFLYADTIGLINTVLRSLGIPTTNWLGDPDVVLFSVTLVNIWKQVGYYMIFYLAGLQNIGKDIYEAAALDGAGYFQQLYYLTLPLLRRTTLFISTIGFIFAFQTVEQLQVLNQGNPADRGNLLLYFIFQVLYDLVLFVNSFFVVFFNFLEFASK